MSPDRRSVRATADFFADLDPQLPPERTKDRPSRSDFQTYELLRIVDQFALGFDSMSPAIPGRADYRLLMISGLVVPRISVVGQLASDGALELVQCALDPVEVSALGERRARTTTRAHHPESSLP